MNFKVIRGKKLDTDTLTIAKALIDSDEIKEEVLALINKWFSDRANIQISGIIMAIRKALDSNDYTNTFYDQRPKSKDSVVVESCEQNIIIKYNHMVDDKLIYEKI